VGAKLGQHFLVDEGVRDSIVAAARLTGAETVLEIGPGRGVLTSELLAQAARVVAVELDDHYAASLAERPRVDVSRLSVVHRDFLAVDLDSLGPGPFVVVGNLPYAVAAPILQRVLAWPRWKTAVLMFQKEVAARITAEPGGPDYGLLTLSVLLRARPEPIADAGRLCFSPPPKVDSAVVRLTRLDEPRLDPEAEKKFFRLAKAAFTQRRKMAAAPLSGAAGKPRAEVVAALERLGVAPSARAQDIPFEAYLALPRELGL
jgi:16S rRNA (adenine1518-N6/adenine1519-N6)-dimethyltransferase